MQLHSLLNCPGLQVGGYKKYSLALAKIYSCCVLLLLCISAKANLLIYLFPDLKAEAIKIEIWAKNAICH